MPIKKAVVKSDADATAASAPAVVRKPRTSSAKKLPVAAEAAPASGEKKARSSKTAVTHRHKKQQQQPESAAISASPEIVVSSVVVPLAPSPAVRAYEPSGEEIAKLAYSYYVARGYQPGDQASDWFRAVNELKARHAAAAYLLED